MQMLLCTLLWVLAFVSLSQNHRDPLKQPFVQTAVHEKPLGDTIKTNNQGQKPDVTKTRL